MVTVENVKKVGDIFSYLIWGYLASKYTFKTLFPIYTLPYIFLSFTLPWAI